jgi:pyruvate/2-oxoglutarate dehydrogenase complex dihydrolipoamide acyltransferase (E2) component
MAIMECLRKHATLLIVITVAIVCVAIISYVLNRRVLAMSNMLSRIDANIPVFLKKISESVAAAQAQPQPQVQPQVYYSPPAAPAPAPAQPQVQPQVYHQSPPQSPPSSPQQPVAEHQVMIVSPLVEEGVEEMDEIVDSVLAQSIDVMAE